MQKFERILRELIKARRDDVVSGLITGGATPDIDSRARGCVMALDEVVGMMETARKREEKEEGRR